MPMYLIEEEGKKTGLVKAVSSSAAIRIATAGRFSATNVKTAEEYADLLAEGVQVIVEQPDAGHSELTGGEVEEAPGDRAPDPDAQGATQQEGTDA